MPFGGAFQSPQRLGRSGDEPPAEDFLDELPPPGEEDFRRTDFHRG
jgi:hypothetical protein